jgi:Gram-negative bacterial TonB protein C-terminal
MLGEIFRQTTIMKNLLLVLGLILLSLSSHSQLVAKVEIKEKIDGICDIRNVYTLFPMFGDQIEAVCSIPDSTIEKRLNDDVEFLKDKPKYNDKGMVSIIINCKGEVVQCKIDNESKSPILDEQVVNVFKTLTSWKAGKLNGKEVDSMRLWSFEVKKGKITLK